MNKPKLSLIAAMANNRVIGKDNKMPWHLPADLQRFKTITMSKPIVMGRKTYESIGHPLSGRQNVVVSRNKKFTADGCDIVESLNTAITLLSDKDEIMIIGGGFLYSQTINMANKLYLTFVNLEVEGDTYFPEYQHLNLREGYREKYLPDGKNIYSYEFVDFDILESAAP